MRSYLPAHGAVESQTTVNKDVKELCKRTRPQSTSEPPSVELEAPTEGSRAELDYAFGTIYAQERLLVHITKMLVVAGITTEKGVQELIRQLNIVPTSNGEFNMGYGETMGKLAKDLTGIN